MSEVRSEGIAEEVTAEASVEQYLLLPGSDCDRRMASGKDLALLKRIETVSNVGQV